MYTTVTPAYGRDYKSKAAAQADWQAGKDFILAATGQLINKAQADHARMVVNIRYAKLRLQCAAGDCGAGG